MDKHRTWQYMAWATVLFIISIASTCALMPPVPDAVGWNITPELRYRANQQIKEVP